VNSGAINGIAQAYFDACRSRDFDRLRSIAFTEGERWR
jgi:hypothetical protein